MHARPADPNERGIVVQTAKQLLGSPLPGHRQDKE